MKTLVPARRHVRTRFLNETEEFYFRSLDDPLRDSFLAVVAVLRRSPRLPDVQDVLARGAREPRFRQRVAGEGTLVSPFFWHDAEQFDPAQHFICTESGQGATLPEVVRSLFSKYCESLDKRMPLWRLSLTHGLPGGGAVVLLKMHHSYMDGAALSMLLTAILGVQSSPPWSSESFATARPDWRTVMRFRLENEINLLGTMWAPVRAALRDPAARKNLARQLLADAKLVRNMIAAPSAPPPSTAVAPVPAGAIGRRLITRRFRTADWAHAAMAHGGGINELFVTVAANALHRYYERIGDRRPSLRLAVPLAARRGTSKALIGNAFRTVLLDLPRSDHGPLALRTARAHVLAARRNNGALHPTLNGLLSHLPRTQRERLSAKALGSTSAVASYMSLPARFTFANAEVEELYGLPPGLGVPCVFMAVDYEGSIHLSINVNLRSVPEADELESLLDDEIRAFGVTA